jgi:hypothetical protein
MSILNNRSHCKILGPNILFPHLAVSSAILAFVQLGSFVLANTLSSYQGLAVFIKNATVLEFF